ncbi:MAG: FHA domain-containing protein [Rhodocyclaceae bacterium]|nr:FHA domain-containing protein [Rhodocyclaceae bacterium]
MAKLILSMDGLVLKEIGLTKERTSIGRKPHNDIQIDNLAISGEHAVIVTILNDSFLEDLNSTNGTYVNGQPVKKHFLQNNDVIELGKYRLKYLNESATGAAAADFEKTMVLRPGALARPPEAAPPAATRTAADTHAGMPGLATQAGPSTQAGAASAPPTPPTFAPAAPAAATPATTPSMVPPTQPAPVAQSGIGVIQILNGASAGRELELVKTLTTLGKPGTQVAVITRRPHGYFITHVEGAQFPVVNGKTLDAQAHALADHDVIEIAGVKMEFFLRT